MGLSKRKKEILREFTDWNESEIKILKNKYGVVPVKELSVILNRSRYSILKKASRLKLKYLGYTQRELDFLYKFYDKISNKEIAEIIGKSVDSIAHKLQELKLKKSKETLGRIARQANKNYASGKRSHLWKGGITNKNKLFYAKRYWKNIRKEKISNEKECFICGNNEELIVHHKQFKIDGGKEESGNLVTLCRICHARLHTLERFYRNNHAIRDFEKLAIEIKNKFHYKEF
jgi:hypothetical protein